jgi:hypothetical protein
MLVEFIEAPIFTRLLGSYYLRADEQIWMLTIYGKDEAKDLTVGERAALRRAVEAEKEGRRRARRADPRR